MTSQRPRGLVPSTTPCSARMITWVVALALGPAPVSRISPVSGSRLVNNLTRASAIRCAGVRTSSGSRPPALSLRSSSR